MGAGLQMGANFDAGSFIWGIEGDVGLGGLSWWAMDDDLFSLDLISSIRGRIGVPINNHLLYATAGVGVLVGTGIDTDTTPNRDTGSAIRPVVGLGFESMLTPSMSVRAEGLAYIGDDVLANNDTIGARIDTVGQLRVGVNYFFGEPGGAEIMVDTTRPDWSHFYVGGYFGGNIAQGLDLESGDFHRNEHGVAAGLQAGVNFDAGAFVWGLEADVGTGGLVWHGSTADHEASLDVVSSIRGRVGVPIDNHLVYATAGVGLLSVYAATSFDTDNRKVLVRPAVGLGVESRITPGISLKAEGLALIGDDKVSFGAAGDEVMKLGTVGQIRLGLNMHLGANSSSKSDYGADLDGDDTVRPNWERFYVGASFGANMGRLEDRDGTYFYHTEHGFASGLQMGMNFDAGSFVWGIEGDVGLGGLVVHATSNRSASLDVVSSLRARIGLPVDNHLIYVTAGASILFGSANTDGGQDPQTDSVIRPVVGLGFESMVTPSLSVRAEGLAHVGGDTLVKWDPDDSEGAYVETVGQLRLGVNYFFGQGGGAEIMAQPERGDWDRYYVGGNIGGAVGYADETGGEFFRTEHGFAAGLQVGRNFDHDSFVWGIEADLGNGGLEWGGNGDGYAEASLDIVASVRGRLGLPVDNHLVYATAGVGILGVSATDGGSDDNMEAFVRPVVGIGVESMISNSVSLKAEGLAHIGTDRMSIDGTGTEGMRLKSVGQIRLGINLHL